MSRSSRTIRLVCGLLLASLTVGAPLRGEVSSPAPVVFWVSDPVAADQTVLVTGQGFSEQPAVALLRLADSARRKPPEGAWTWPGKGQTLAAIQPCDASVKFIVPAGWKPGVYGFRISGRSGNVCGLLNRPVLWWVQGDAGLAASPGGWLRGFGKNLAGRAPGAGAPTVLLRGPVQIEIKASGDGYALKADLPADLAAGEYQVFVHSGCGGAAAWSAPVPLTVANRVEWPGDVFDVKRLGAAGNGTADDTPTVHAALDAARRNGGGVVYFPRGRYRLSAPLNVPTKTVLRGAARDLTQLFWGDGSDGWKRTATDRMPCVIQGTHDFGIEDIMLWFVNANNGVLTDQSSPDAGNVFVRRVRMQWLLYGGYITIQEANDVFKQTSTDGGAGAKGVLLQLGGRNVEVTDCDLESSGSVFWLVKGRGVRIANNRLRIGRLGYCFVHDAERLIIEDNHFAGADNMARSALFFSSHLDLPTVSRVYLARNRFTDIWGHDRECNSTDGASGQYFGTVRAATPTQVTLAEPGSWKPDQLAGHTLYIVGGRGKGQWRRIVASTADTVTVAEPFVAPPDATSVMGINHTMERFLVLDNEYQDVRIAFQFYGTAMEGIVAGNRAARAGGFWSHASHYAGPPAKGAQPQFYVQYIENRITEGNYVHAVPCGYQYGDADSVVGVGAHPSQNPDKSPWRWPMAIGFVLRGNRLESNARIRVCASPGAAAPLLEDAVVEQNHVARSRFGIDVTAGCARVFLRGNAFEQVACPLSGDGIGATGLHPAELTEARVTTLGTLVAERFGELPPDWERVLATVRHLRAVPADDPGLPAACANAFRTVWDSLGRWKPTGHSMQLLQDLAGFTLNDPGWKDSTLHRLLFDGTGGRGEWPLTATLAANATALQVELTPRWPSGWSADTPTFRADLEPGKATRLPVVATLPKGAWGPYSLPVTVRLTAAGLPAIEAEQVFTVGGGVVLDFAVIGPFPYSGAAELDNDVHPPERRLHIAEEVNGLGGKVHWEPVRSRNIDLAGKYKPTGAATAYVLACLRTTEKLRATLLVACEGGLRVWLNDEEVPALRGKPGTATVDLGQGDNVILLKINSTASGKWAFTFLNVDELGQRVGGRIRVVPAAELKSVPALLPPALPLATGPLRHDGAVTWRLLYENNFDAPDLTAPWRVAAGTWKVAGGVLAAEGPKAFACVGQKVKAPVRIEYDARSAEPGDLSACHLDDPPDFMHGVLIGFASNDNKINKIVSDGDQVADSQQVLAKPGKWHHVIAQVLADGTVQLYVDDQLALEHRSATPLGRAMFPGLWTWATAEFDNIRIYAGE